VFIEEFLKHWGPRSQSYEDTLQEEEIFYDSIESDEDLIEEQDLEEEIHEESHKIHEM
jgi:hypothetical protein